MEPESKSFLSYLDETRDISLDAELAQAAYYYTPKVRDWILDEELSNTNRSVYTKAGKAKVAFRGTDLSRSETMWDDLGTDALILFGLQDKGTRFKNAQKTTESVIKKYGKSNVSLTGHSLGGAQSAWVSRKTGLPATGFNSGWGPADALRKRTYSKFMNITTEGDVVSSMGKYNPTITQLEIKPTTGSAHSLENFLEHHFPNQDVVMSSRYTYQPRSSNIIQAGFENSVYGLGQ